MLYLVPTPIGNLGDITLRALETLKTVDIIYAEDTRRTRQLLNHFDIQTRLRSYYEHNKEKAGDEVISHLRDGLHIALVSDAGMPCISDPGLDLVHACIEQDLPFTVLPGATAFATAFAGSGFPAHGFCFMGFLPKTRKGKLRTLSAIRTDPRVHVFYESPHALLDTLSAIDESLGGRRLCLARELTKLHEEYLRGTAAELLEVFRESEPRGEFVAVIKGAEEEESEPSPGAHEELEARIMTLLSEGMSVKTVAEKLAAETGLRKKQIYDMALRMK